MLIALPLFASAIALNAGHNHIVAMPTHEYREDCGTKRAFGLVPGAAALLQQENVPGAGIDKFEPFEKVLKDGFLVYGCVKDYMYYRGDKFGDNKHDYKLGQRANVSIVHYEAFVAKEDRHEMTQKVCFEFCRTVPNMGFFGIVNGRGCYCTPYFKPMESDSEICDSVCEGDNTLMCGGKSKSSIFAMHFCASTEEDLAEKFVAAGAAMVMKSSIDFKVGNAKQVADHLQGAGETIQKNFGAVGDSGATSHAQAAKVFAGKLLHKADEAKKVSTKIGKLGNAGSALKDFHKPETVTKAERIMEETDETVAKGEAVADELDELIAQGVGEEAVEHKINSSAQYYPIMYFVDKEFDSVPSTCAGDMVGEPIVGTEDTCATTCDTNIHSCVGYQFFSNGAASICVLLSKFTSAFYYTGCGPSKKSALVQAPSFLQRDITGKTTAKFLLMGKKEACPFDTEITSPAECLEAYNTVGAGNFKYPAQGKYSRAASWNPAFPTLEPLFVGAWPGVPNHCSMQFEATPDSPWVEDYKDQTPHFSTNAATDNAKFNSGEYRMLCKKMEKAEVQWHEPKCVAKLSKFEGTTLKPDGSGKCKQCLKDLTKADRCYK